MRRGASLSSQIKKPAVMADLDDLESGGVASGVGGAGMTPLMGGEDRSSLGGNGGVKMVGLGVSPKYGGAKTMSNPMEMASASGKMHYDSGKAKKRRCNNRHSCRSLLMDTAMTGGMSTSSLQMYPGLLVLVVIAGAMALPLQMRILWLVYGAVVFGAMASLWLCGNVLSCDDGTPEMRAVVGIFKNEHELMFNGNRKGYCSALATLHRFASIFVMPLTVDSTINFLCSRTPFERVRKDFYTCSTR